MSGGPLGVILAGGRARRMGGGDKGLLRLGEARILDRVVARLAPQVDAMVLNANGPAGRFAGLGLGVVPDALDDLGPLGGVLAGLDHAAAAGHRAIVTAASDSPFLPEDLVERLQAPRRPMAIAEADGRLHPVFGLWPVALRERLRADLGAGTRRVADWALAHGAARVAFPAPDAFFNVNTAEDLARAEAML